MHGSTKIRRGEDGMTVRRQVVVSIRREKNSNLVALGGMGLRIGEREDTDRYRLDLNLPSSHPSLSFPWCCVECARGRRGGRGRWASWVEGNLTQGGTGSTSYKAPLSINNAKRRVAHSHPAKHLHIL